MTAVVHQPTEGTSSPLAAFYPPGQGAADGEIVVRHPVAGVGQGAQNEIVLDDDTVSTNHARLEYADGGWRLTDLGSKNGTYVDGVRLAEGVPTSLPNFASVSFGACRLEFRSDESADPERARAVYQPPAEKSATTRRAGFRLPVWLLLLVFILAALLLFLFMWLGGDAPVNGLDTQPVVATLTELTTSGASRPPEAV